MEIVSGIITRGVGGLYEVDTENEIIECKAKGVFRHDMIAPTVGDRVTVEKDKDSAVISKIEERKNLLIRPPLANLDIIFCVIPSKDPAPDLFTLDKLIAIAEKNSIEPVIIVTKSDLDNASADRIVSIYKKSGFSVFGVSTYDEESVNILRSFIKEHARGKISAFAGASGAGKSTLMNSLFPSLKIVTGTLSKKTARGRHTTRAVDLYPFSRISPDMSDGYLADTPGFTMLDFEHFDFMTLDELPYSFREFDDYIGLCRYTKCTHLKEEGCAIIEAIKNGDISRERHESYVSLYATLKAKPYKSNKK